MPMNENRRTLRIGDDDWERMDELLVNEDFLTDSMRMVTNKSEVVRYAIKLLLKEYDE